MKMFVSLSVLAVSLLAAACGNPNAPRSTAKEVSYIVVQAPITQDGYCFLRARRLDGPADGPTELLPYRYGNNGIIRQSFRLCQMRIPGDRIVRTEYVMERRTTG